MKLEDDTPIFSKKRVNFSPPDTISHMAVGSDIIIIVMNNGILLRINLRNPDNPEGIRNYYLLFSTHSGLSIDIYKMFYRN